ncbi:MAG TPA: NAD-binding protein [Blastocatellia bacterium]|jgi:trk system potassium uptake protein TrkA|nr:NAD-binding protein [Blastocatellia bacterium]
MKIVVIGYGRVGSRTVAALIERGHEISLIDKEASRLGRASHLEGVELIQGNGIDVDVQREAGMGEADLLLALTFDDNVNLMAAQVGRSHFSVPRAIARVYEPTHAEATQEDPQLIVVCPTLFAAKLIVEEVDIAASMPVDDRIPTVPPKAQPRRRVNTTDESRYILIAGGGKVGVNLARELYENGHEVAVIERDNSRAAALVNKLDCPVFIGDSSTHNVLETAGAPRARVFVAATGSDQDNLIACQVAKKVFGVPKTIARASNPKNEEVMARLGVDSTVSSTAIIEQVIERELPTVRIKTLLSLQSGAFQILEYPLDAYSPATGHLLRDIDLPPESNLIAILRGNTTVVPRGETTLSDGDVVVALVNTEQEAQLRIALLGA